MPALKVGLVGAGGIANAHAPAWLLLGAELHAFSPHSVDEFAGRYGAQVARSRMSCGGVFFVIAAVWP